MNNNLHFVFILCTVSCLKANKPFLLGACVFIIYSLFVSVFIDILIVNSLFNNPKYDYHVFWLNGFINYGTHIKPDAQELSPLRD